MEGPAFSHILRWNEHMKIYWFLSPKPGGKNVPLQKTGRRLGAFWFSLKVLALSIFDFKKELNSNPEKVEKNTPPVAFLAWNTGNNAKKTTFFKLMGH